MDEIRLLQRDMRANSLELEGVMASLSKHFREHPRHASQELSAVTSSTSSLRQRTAALAQTSAELRDATASFAKVAGAMHETATELQVSVGRLAAQQDAHASRVQAHLDALAGGSKRMRLTLEAAFEVMANRFDALESMERRLADLEAWRKKQAG